MTIFNKIRKWGRDRNITCSDKQLIKLQEEVGELASAHLKGDIVSKIDAIGDIVVVLTIYCDQNGLKIEDCVDDAYSVIENRKGKTIQGTFIKD